MDESTSESRGPSDSINLISAPSSMDVDDCTSRQSSESTSTNTEDNIDNIRPVTAPPTASSSLSADPHANNAPNLVRAKTAPAPNMASSSGADQNVRVVARVRPLSSKELAERSSESIRAFPALSTIDVKSANSDGLSVGNDKRKFEFDSVFGPTSTQAEVYERTAGDMIKSSIYRGFNATILAYGQTGSGKTFTMGTDGGGGGDKFKLGQESDLVPPSPSDGVIARAVYDLFEARNSLPNGKDRVKVEMSYLEIYNEQAIDLLSNDPSSTTLQVRDSRTEGVVVQNLKSFPVFSPTEVQKLMEQASQKRAVGSTHMNSVSSRSHAICTLNVSIAPLESSMEEGPEVPSSPREGMRAKLTLVDLAGSERIKRTGAEGARMKEGININKGLFVLGQVVSALSELGQQGVSSSRSKHNAHIPYRDSKLTRLLQDSLGGNSKTVMIACISPAESNIEESINTLRYAERTRNIKNSAVRNVVGAGLSPSEAAALRRENQQLKLELAQMEAKMQTSKGNINMAHSGSVRGFGGLQVLHSSETIGTVAKLQAQCSSFMAEIDLLKEKAESHTEEVLEASLRADKWQNRYENTMKLAKEQGIVLPRPEDDKESESLVSQLRNQLNECKADLLEARTDAAIARATAGAIIAGNGDITAIGENVNSVDCNEDEEDNPQKETLTTELSAVSEVIERKEAMVEQMRKERACRDNLQFHFENSLKMLQSEVETLTAERDELITKVSTSIDEKTNAPNRRKRKATDDPVEKRLRGQISKLEDRINELKRKANEHTKSIKMKEEAEKKCAKLMAEIAEDKRHRAELQRKLKEASAEIRAEKKQAQQKAARLMKDSQKLKIELTKMKNAAERQAAVLKRKIDEAAAKEKARADLERKRKSAERMRLATSSHENTEVSEKRRDELVSWIDKEVEYSIIKTQIDEQKKKMELALSEKRKLMKNNDMVNVEELEQIETTIRSLRETTDELETTAKKAFPESQKSVSVWRFLNPDAFKALSKPDAKFVLSYLFDMCSSVKQEMADLVVEQETSTKLAVDSALASEKKKHDRNLTKLKMEHAEATLNLLESTQSAVSSNIQMKMAGGDITTDFKEQVENMIGTYMKSCSSAGQALKSDLDEMKESAEGMQKMIDDVAKGMVVAKKKSKSTQKKAAAIYNDDSDSFELEDEDDLSLDGGDDSEYEPTPKTKRRRSKRLEKKAVNDSPASLVGEGLIDDETIETMKVASLKKALRRKGLPMTGKKADLKNRLRENILSSSMAMNESLAKDTSFASTSKRVDFVDDGFIGDIAVEVSDDPEFQPQELEPSETSTIKKQLWAEKTGNSFADVDESAIQNESRTTINTLFSPKIHPSHTTSQPTTPSRVLKSPMMRHGLNPAENSDDKENHHGTPTPSKNRKPSPLGFLTSSPRRLSSRPLGVHNHNRSINTVSSSKKRLPTTSRIPTSATKRARRGMNSAVMSALDALSAFDSTGPQVGNGANKFSSGRKD